VLHRRGIYCQESRAWRQLRPVDATCDGGLSFKTIAWEALKDNINYTSWHNGVKISCLGAFPVFPEEVIDMCRFAVTFDGTEYDRFVENGNVRLLLLYSGGTDEKNMNVKLLR
jgi:hypothetical protein